MNSKNHLDLLREAYTSNFSYDSDNQLMLQWYPNRIVPKLQRGSILELGLGHGYSTEIFSQFTDDYRVIDGSQAIIEQFILEHPGLSSVNITHSFFEDYTTDKPSDNIIMGFVLEHVDDPLATLMRFKQFLKPDGKIFIAVPNATSLHRQIGFHAGLINDVYQLSAADLELGHKRIFDVNSLQHLIKQCNLTINSIEGLFLKPLTTGQLQQLSLSDEIFQGMMTMGINYPELSNAVMVECSL